MKKRRDITKPKKKRRDHNAGSIVTFSDGTTFDLNTDFGPMGVLNKVSKKEEARISTPEERAEMAMMIARKMFEWFGPKYIELARNGFTVRIIGGDNEETTKDSVLQEANEVPKKLHTKKGQKPRKRRRRQ
jgi:hypothetical protein